MIKINYQNDIFLHQKLFFVFIFISNYWKSKNYFKEIYEF